MFKIEIKSIEKQKIARTTKTIIVLMKYNLNRGNKISCHLPGSIKEVVLRIYLLMIYYWYYYCSIVACNTVLLEFLSKDASKRKILFKI